MVQSGFLLGSIGQVVQKAGSTARAAGLMRAARSQKQRVQTTSDDKDNQCNINGQRRANYFVFLVQAYLRLHSCEVAVALQQVGGTKIAVPRKGAGLMIPAAWLQSRQRESASADTVFVFTCGVVSPHERTCTKDKSTATHDGRQRAAAQAPSSTAFRCDAQVRRDVQPISGGVYCFALVLTFASSPRRCARGSSQFMVQPARPSHNY